MTKETIYQEEETIQSNDHDAVLLIKEKVKR